MGWAAPSAHADAISHRTGTYQSARGDVACVWFPNADSVSCATRAMARRGASWYLDGDGVDRQFGEPIRGGRRMKRGAELSTSSIECTFGRTSIRCRYTLGPSHGFKLGAGTRRWW